MKYEEFIAGKVVKADSVGFDVPSDQLGAHLFDFQREIVHWALRKGRAAFFWGCGLGKTAAQLEWAWHVHLHTGGDVLILAPLAVAAQTAAEGERFGRLVTVCRTQDDVRPGLNVTNYEMLDHFDATHFVGVVLDESSILKSYMGATKRLIIDSFALTPYRLACTATPAPNDHMELGNHSEFLGVLPSNDMLARWFINTLEEAGVYRLKGHAEADFWRWVATWATAIESPADLGFDGSHFVLPALKIHRHVVDVDVAPPEGKLFHVGAPSATELHAEMRQTTDARADVVARMVAAEPEDTWLVWCNTNYEADAMTARVAEAVEIRGAESAPAKQEKLERFTAGGTRVLVTKPSIAGWGLNWQHCARVVFVGLGYSFEQYYQAIRRTWRFGQQRPVDCHVICAETEQGIVDTIRRKEEDHTKMLKSMVSAMRETSLEELHGKRGMVLDHQRETTTGDGWEMRLGDCVQELRDVPADSIGLSVFSPPFANLYIYSDAAADMGNTSSMDEFMAQFGYLVEELHRVTIPGRIVAVHCKDLPRYAGRDGSAGLIDFPGRIIRTFEERGWTYHSRVTIWKCPVTEMTRTKNHGLLYKQLRKDSTASRQGMADFVVAFRKWGGQAIGSFPDPVAHPEADMTGDKYAGNGRVIPLRVWQEWASPVWMDINQTDTLNGRVAREDGDEKHICPLQLGVIERCVILWSNEGDLVLSPFAGIGSEGYVARKLSRRFLGIELKRSYYEWAVKHLRDADAENAQQSLFAPRRPNATEHPDIADDDDDSGGDWTGIDRADSGEAEP